MLLEINEKSFVNGVKKKAQSKSEKFVCYKNCFMICKRNMARAFFRRALAWSFLGE